MSQSDAVEASELSLVRFTRAFSNTEPEIRLKRGISWVGHFWILQPTNGVAASSVRHCYADSERAFPSGLSRVLNSASVTNSGSVQPHECWPRRAFPRLR